MQNVDLNAGESQRPNRIRDGFQDKNLAPGVAGSDFPFYDIGAFQSVPVCDEDADPICPGEP